MAKMSKRLSDNLEDYRLKNNEQIKMLKKKDEEFELEREQDITRTNAKLATFCTKLDFAHLNEKLKGFVTWQQIEKQQAE